MAITRYNIKRWTLMLTGKSIYHVEQKIGKAIDRGGYYNDLTEKVTKGDESLNADGIPVLTHSDGKKVEMPTMIFQYGLGAYDLWLLKHEKKYLDKAMKCGEWALEHQHTNGSWNNFFYIYPDNPYSAMPQGEGASLLLRIYNETREEKWLVAANKAIRYMLKEKEDGGVTQKKGNEIVFLEYTHLPVVLNGWIFAFFGLYDMSLCDSSYTNEVEKAVRKLKKELNKYDNGYWSLYDEKGMIASPFYHNLHIALLEALYVLTEDEIFKEYQEKFEAYKDSWINAKRAFIVKAVQKIKEK